MCEVCFGQREYCAHWHNDLREKPLRFDEHKVKPDYEPQPKQEAAAGTGYGPFVRAIASEPRRSLAIRALPLPDSIG